MKLNYFFNKCVYDLSLIDGKLQSSFLFTFIDEIKQTLQRKLHLVGGVALLCAIEIAGRTALSFYEPEKKFNNTTCFNFFLERYMNYGELLKKEPKLYDIFRNGFAHEGFPKIRDYQDGGFGTGYTEIYLKIYQMSKEDLRGFVVKDDQRDVILDLLLYEFLEGVIKFHSDEVKNGWHY